MSTEDSLLTWTIDRIKTLFEHPLFELERHFLKRPQATREAVVLRTPDWVNIIALDDAQRVLLVRQWRFGLQAPTLEIPGGMVEGESEQDAAQRELLEETGYQARHWRRLGEVHPNPAFITNVCGTWVATELERLGPPEGDGEEELELEVAPLAGIPDLIRAGAITHSLVIAAFHLLDLDDS